MDITGSLTEKRLLWAANLSSMGHYLKLKKSFCKAICDESPYSGNREKRQSNMFPLLPQNYKDAKTLFLINHEDEPRIYLLERMATLATDEEEIKETITGYIAILEQLPEGELKEEITFIFERFLTTIPK